MTNKSMEIKTAETTISTFKTLIPPLDIFENELRLECKRLYLDLKDGSRKKKLLSKELNSLIDVLFIGRPNPFKLFRSCIITFGHALERATMDFAEKMGAEIYRNKHFLSSNMDIVFRIKNTVYNLESKANIELDLGKTKKVVETLDRKNKIIFNALDCQSRRWQVISKIVVWTKETSKDAMKIAKEPLTEKKLMGFKDFFMVFNINLTKDEFFSMLQKVWIDEVEKYLE